MRRKVRQPTLAVGWEDIEDREAVALKHIHLISRPKRAENDGPSLNLLLLLVTPLLALYGAIGQVLRLVVPGFEKDFIGPEQF